MTNCDDNAVQLWDKACDILKSQVCPETFEQWFHGIVPLTIDQDVISLGVSDEFFASWLETHFEDMIINALHRIHGEPLGIQYHTGYDPPCSHEPDRSPAAANTTDEGLLEETSTQSDSGPFCQKYTFSNFVVGEENRYAYTACEVAAKSPGIYNPLYIYGGTGLGKTHLLQAIGSEVCRQAPGKVVEFITCENFLNLYVDSIRSKKHMEFRNRFRNSDVLLIDDVHQLANKTQLQEEFFNTFNNLYHANKQIVMTSDKPPSEIKGLEERLVSRFESGVSTEITVPSLETRLAILKTKQKEYLIELDDQVLLFLSSGITSNIRRLEGALIKLAAYSSAMANCEITIDVAEFLLADILKEEKSGRKVTIESIQRKVADYFDIRVSDIRGSKRPKSIAVPRMIAMYLSRELTQLSFPAIAESFGGKNHATIIHAHKKINKSLEQDSEIKNSVGELKSQLLFQ